MSDSFGILRPATQTSALVFASPHSGRAYSAAFLQQSILNPHMLRSSEDAYVDQLFADAPRCGAPLLTATVPRAYVDLNRAPDDLDPAVIDGATRAAHNPRIASGLGVIPRVVAGGRAIYSGKLPMSEAQARLTAVWTPYHAALRKLLDETYAQFGQVILLDCHSTPREALDLHRRSSQPRPDIVLGDRHGTSAGAGITDRIEAAFVSAGLRVARNSPFAGAYIAQAYGRPSAGRHVVQIEIDRSLYMNEAQITPLAGFSDFQRLISGVIAQLTGAQRRALPLAAE